MEKGKQSEAIRFLRGSLGFLAFETGDYAEMLKYVQKASSEAKKNPGDRVQSRDALALAWLKNGDRKKAYQLLDELKQSLAKIPRGREVYDYSAAIIAFEEGKYGEALEKFKAALAPQLPNRAPQFYYAVCLLKTGHLAEAIDELKRATWWSPISLPTISLTFLPAANYWPIASVKAHYWLGVAYEQKGDNEAAKKEYEKFLEIWKEADFNSPEIADAKQRLERLRKKV